MFPTTATLCEVGLRDGFQSEDRVAPTDLKLELIDDLVRTGLREIQVASFVHPGWVPQMADAELLWERLEPRDGVIFSGLVLNMKGLERAKAAGVEVVDLSISTSEAHSKANANMSLEEARRQMLAMIEECHRHEMVARAGMQCVFGCANGERIPVDRVVRMAGEIARAGAESVSLADSTGVANPLQIKEVLSAVKAEILDVPVVMHLHDTRGLGLANLVAALEMEVTRFDTSIGGMGGCPFINGATGNVATEDAVYLLESIGVATGVDIERVARITRKAEQFFERRFPGKLHRLILDRGAGVAL